MVPESVPHALGVKLCEPTYAQPATCSPLAFLSLTSFSAPESTSSSESVSSEMGRKRLCLPFPVPELDEPAMRVLRSLKIPRIICREVNRLVGMHKCYDNVRVTLVCISTRARLLFESWNRCLGKFFPSHWFFLQNIVPPPYSKDQNFCISTFNCEFLDKDGTHRQPKHTILHRL